MDTSELPALLETIAAASAALTAQTLADADQAELAAIIGAAVVNLRAADHLARPPTGGGSAALHAWQHTVMGQIALFITAADLLAGDADYPLPAAARACALEIYDAAARMRAVVDSYIAAHDSA